MAAELQPFWERLSGHCIRLIAYEHTDGARPHCHAYVEGATVSTDTMKNWIKRALSVTTFPKGDWVFATPKPDQTPEGFITYMSKGKYEPCHNKGFEPNQVNTLKGNWLSYATILRTQSHKKPVQPVLKWQDMLDIAEVRLRKDQLQTDSISRVQELAIQIAHKVVYTENRAIVGRHKFRDFVDTLMAIVADDERWRRNQNNFFEYK